jgi:hypothetical protein
MERGSCIVTSLRRLLRQGSSSRIEFRSASANADFRVPLLTGDDVVRPKLLWRFSRPLLATQGREATLCSWTSSYSPPKIVFPPGLIVENRTMHDPMRLGRSLGGYWSNSICLMNVTLPLSFLTTL